MTDHIPSKPSLTEEALSERTNAVFRIGQLLLQNGATSQRTYGVLHRLGSSLGCEGLHIYISHSAILMSTLSGAHARANLVRSATDIGANFSAIARLSRLAESMQRHELDLTEFREELEHIAQAKPLYPRWFQPWTAGLGCACVSFLFGGDPGALLATFIGSTIGFACLLFLIRHPFNPYLVTLITAFITAVCANLLGMWDLSETPQIAIAASVLFLVPAVPLICGLLDLVLGHTLSGLGRLSHGLFQCLSIGLGIILALELAGGSL